MHYIINNQSVFDLCKRPSMLHMTMSILPSLYKEDTQKKISATSLMNKYVEFWISRQESKEIRGYFSKNDNRKKDFIIYFFIELASIMYAEKTLLISKAKLDNLIDAEIEKINPDIKSKEEDYEGFKNEIYSGYFIEVDINYSNENNFRFVHKSIFEFFVSKKIINLIKDRSFNHKLWNIEWDNEIIDFVDNEIDVSTINNYPKLILLRDSLLDKFIFIPMTKFTDRDLFKLILLLIVFGFANTFVGSTNEAKNEEVNFYVIFSIFVATFFIMSIIKKIKTIIKKRIAFISKAYFIDFFKKGNPIESRRLQHFLDFNKLFYSLYNIELKKYTFEKNYFTGVFVNDSLFSEITFNHCLINRLHFNYSQLDNIKFNECRIKFLKFDNCVFNNIKIETSIIKKRRAILRELLTYLSYVTHLIEFNKKNRALVKRRLLRGYTRKLIFSNMDIKNFDDESIISFQNYIKNNNINRKDVLCNMELKNILFQHKN